MSVQTISEEQLHAYADGHLDAAERLRVAAWLEERPAVQEQLAAWRDQNGLLHRRYDSVMQEPIPARLTHAARNAPRAIPLRIAAAVAWLTLGVLAGYVTRGHVGGTGQLETAALPKAAAVAHVVFVPEVRHPVEVTADQEQHLVTWLSKRLGAPVKAPALRNEGFELVGGRLLPGESGPVAQFMYQDTRGQRLTLYVRTDASDNRETAFRFAQEGKVGVFYWLDGKLGYALSGEIAKPDLMRVADSVYRQLNP